MTAMIRHIANLGLLLSFVTLAVTGVMSFVLPFSITTTRVHIVFGTATMLLVGLHLATRTSYFTRIARQSFERKLNPKSKPVVPRWLVGAIMLGWIGLLAVSFYGTQPASGLLGLSYESRHRAEIFRASPQTVYEQIGLTNTIASLSPASGELVIAVEIEYRDAMAQQPAAAVWAQTTGVPGRMIQTLYLDEALAYSDKPVWHGTPTPRHHILPIWRHSYRDINGVDPTGDVDAITSATPKHSFSIEQSLTSDEDEIVVCLEFNAHGDPNDAYSDPHLGQPSVYYTALIDLTEEQDYYLMTRTAHGGGAEQDGHPRYEFEELTTAKDMIKKVLVQIKRPAKK